MSREVTQEEIDALHESTGRAPRESLKVRRHTLETANEPEEDDGNAPD